MMLEEAEYMCDHRKARGLRRVESNLIVALGIAHGSASFTPRSQFEAKGNDAWIGSESWYQARLDWTRSWSDIGSMLRHAS
jgi:hypothetical protein